MSQLDNDDDMDPDEEPLPIQTPYGFHLQELKPVAIDQALVKH